MKNTFKDALLLAVSIVGLLALPARAQISDMSERAEGLFEAAEYAQDDAEKYRTLSDWGEIFSCRLHFRSGNYYDRYTSGGAWVDTEASIKVFGDVINFINVKALGEMEVWQPFYSTGAAKGKVDALLFIKLRDYTVANVTYHHAFLADPSIGAAAMYPWLENATRAEQKQQILDVVAEYRTDLQNCPVFKGYNQSMKTALKTKEEYQALADDYLRQADEYATEAQLYLEQGKTEVAAEYQRLAEDYEAAARKNAEIAMVGFIPRRMDLDYRFLYNRAVERDNRITYSDNSEHTTTFISKKKEKLLWACPPITGFIFGKVGARTGNDVAIDISPWTGLMLRGDGYEALTYMGMLGASLAGLFELGIAGEGDILSVAPYTKLDVNWTERALRSGIKFAGPTIELYMQATIMILPDLTALVTEGKIEPLKLRFSLWEYGPLGQVDIPLLRLNQD